LTASTGISDTSYSGSKTNSAQYDDSNMGQNKIGLNFSLPLYQCRNGLPLLLLARAAVGCTAGAALWAL
ncbi:hypothetical protein KU710_23290, partial [Salmonella enterica subsp. enterica serovar Give]|nr:hypothetical protein [Salmonella enterica subsp. enterica serovar Give]